MSKKIEILDIEWATTNNYVDCGIFVMRHMESYKGNGLAGFETQFQVEGAGQKKQLDDLRGKYVAKIILSDFNSLVNHTTEKVREYDRLSKEVRSKFEKAAKAKIGRRLAKALGS